ncbi:zinc finger bed domain-containing 1-like, partial [Olea europaea subsp. europaea]
TDILEEFNGVLTKKKPKLDSLINDLWAIFMVENNVSIRCVESRSFRDFARVVNSNWKYANRHKFSNNFIPAISKSIQKKFVTYAEKNNNMLTVEFDHWSDIVSRSMLGVIFTLPDGSRYLQDLIDVSIDGHSANKTLLHLRSTLATIPISSINSIVSDSASACKLTRELLVKETDFKHVIQHRCMAHLMNRMGTVFGDNEHIRESFTWASKVVNSVSHNQKLLAILRESHQRRPKKACQVRWFSTVNMIESLLDAKDSILNTFQANLAQTRGNWDWMEDEFSWNNIKRSLQILRPLADCIALSERKTGSL